MSPNNGAYFASVITSPISFPNVSATLCVANGFLEGGVSHYSGSIYLYDDGMQEYSYEPSVEPSAEPSAEPSGEPSVEPSFGFMYGIFPNIYNSHEFDFDLRLSGGQSSCVVIGLSNHTLNRFTINLTYASYSETDNWVSDMTVALFDLASHTGVQIGGYNMPFMSSDWFNRRTNEKHSVS